jgi:poly-gamma-glutamate capsule biosynthesis protein CapA/YwtB (metallophosphatase superfamily)
MSNNGIHVRWHNICLLLAVVLLSYTGFSQVRVQTTDSGSSLAHVRTIDYENDRLEVIDSFRLLHLIIAGNIYQSEYQIRHAFNPSTKKYDFSYELRYINPVLNLGDVVIANIKTGFTGDNTSPFSSPDEFAYALKFSGLNNCVMANLNTAYLDKSAMMRTKRALEIFDIHSTGAFTDNGMRNGNYPLIIERKGFKIALLNYANISQRPGISRDYIINQVDHIQIERDMKVARSLRPDFIIVYLDWGSNYQESPAYSQEAMGKFILEQGANLVVGTFPNTVQRIDVMNYYYANKEKEGLVCYSLGNLISGSNETRSKSGIIMDINLKKNNFTGETTIGDYGFIPVWNYYDTSGKKRTYVIPVASVEQDQLFNNLPKNEKYLMSTQAMAIRKMLGRSSDEIQYNLTEIVVENVAQSTMITRSPLNNKFNPFDEKNLAKSSAPTVKQNIPVTEDTVYRIQFYELKKLVPIDTAYYDHLKGYEVLFEGGTYRYLLGNSTNLATILKLYDEVMKPRYKTCFIVAYYQGRRVRTITPW